MFQISSLTVESSAKIEGVLDVDSNKIINVDTSTEDFDAVNKVYVDTIALSGSAQDLESVLSFGNEAGSYEIDMSGNKIVNTATPESSGDVANKYYVDTLVDSLSGGDNNVDGGFAASAYLPIQNIDGGNA